MSSHTNNEQEEQFEFGIYTLGDLSADPVTGIAASARQRIKAIVAAAKIADEAGIDIFGVGEHHRLDFAVSSPPVLLAAIAQATSRIRLTSATTVLGTADPVRVFEDFSTLDLLSDGRAEIIAGRGAYTESFPLFGYELDDYKDLFLEKMNLLLQLNEKETITWSGKLRSSLNEAEIAPRPIQPELPLWIGVGGTPESAALAGTLGTGMALALLGGAPERFKHLVDVYKEAAIKAGHKKMKVGITSHGYLARTSEQAMDEFYPYYANYYSQFMGGGQHGNKLTREQFEQLAHPSTALAVGSPQQITEKILAQHELFGHNRFMIQMDIGGMPMSKISSAIELLAAEVAPVVRRELNKKKSAL